VGGQLVVAVVAMVDNGTNKYLYYDLCLRNQNQPLINSSIMIIFFQFDFAL
jgi:hypothetical protein